MTPSAAESARASAHTTGLTPMLENLHLDATAPAAPADALRRPIAVPAELSWTAAHGLLPDPAAGELYNSVLSPAGALLSRPPRPSMPAAFRFSPSDAFISPPPRPLNAAASVHIPLPSTSSSLAVSHP